MAMDCIKHMQKIPGVEIVFLFFDPKLDDPVRSISQFAEHAGIPATGSRRINSPEAIERVEKAKPDWIFSINNFRIIKETLLAIPSKGTVNFHNGPLPYYRGVHIPSWAIINGETEHGVSWHYVNAGIDTGDLVGQRRFEVGPEDTAASLMIRCIREGIRLFKEIFEPLIQGELPGNPQPEAGSYFSLQDRPTNDGWISLGWPWRKIDRMVRGLNFLPFENRFMYARLGDNGKWVILNELSFQRELTLDEYPGLTIQANEEGVMFACVDAVFRIESAMTAEMEELSNAEICKALGL
jgi:methionyl-tRNA formyltransferase